MKKNTTATALPPFHLADSKSNDWRRNLGLTDDRAQEIIDGITSHIKNENGETDLTPAMEYVGNLPLQEERLYGAFAIGHGAGQADDATENPLAALLGMLDTEGGLEGAEDDNYN